MTTRATSRRARRRRSRVVTVFGVAAAVSAIAWVALQSRSQTEPRGSLSPRPAVRTEQVAYQWQPQGRADPMTPMPAYASQPAVEPLYRFALAHPELLTYIPCTCGCGAEGHRSNWNCYVRGVTPQGKIIFDEMAPT
jgi:hypothetical protein